MTRREITTCSWIKDQRLTPPKDYFLQYFFPAISLLYFLVAGKNEGNIIIFWCQVSVLGLLSAIKADANDNAIVGPSISIDGSIDSFYRSMRFFMKRYHSLERMMVHHEMNRWIMRSIISRLIREITAADCYFYFIRSFSRLPVTDIPWTNNKQQTLSFVFVPCVCCSWFTVSNKKTVRKDKSVIGNLVFTLWTVFYLPMVYLSTAAVIYFLLVFILMQLLEKIPWEGEFILRRMNSMSSDWFPDLGSNFFFLYF